MPKGLKLSKYVKKEARTITLSIPLEQFQILEKLAEATNRAVNDVTGELFSDHMLPKIRKMLSDAATAQGKESAPIKADGKAPPQLQRSPSEPSAPDLKPTARMDNPAPPRPVAASQNITSPNPIPSLRSLSGSAPMQPRPPQLPTQPSFQQPPGPSAPPPKTHSENG